MSSLNKVILVGRVGKTPETKYLPSGVPVTSFSIAVQGTKKGDDGRYESDWFDCVSWNKTAEFVNTYIGKGQEVSIDGRLEVQKWVDQTTGTKRTRVQIVAERVGFIGGKPQNHEEEGQYVPAPAGHTDTGDATADDPFADE
jgi:single-strand DNA-binding protein